MQGKECAKCYRYVELRINQFKFRRNIIQFCHIRIEVTAFQEKFDNAPKV